MLLRNECTLLKTVMKWDNADKCAMPMLIRMLELSLSRTFAANRESSMYGTFASRERKCHGTFAPRNENVVELSFPRAKKSWNFHCQSETLGYKLIIYVRNRDTETCMHSELAIEMGSEKFLIDGVPTLHSRQTFEKVCYVIFYTASTVSSCMIYSRPTFVVVGSVKDPILLSVFFLGQRSTKMPKFSAVSIWFFLPSRIWHPRSLSSPWNFGGEVNREETSHGLPGGESCTILASSIFDWSTRVTDGRTDGR